MTLPLPGDKLYGRTDDEFLAFVKHVKAGYYGPFPADRTADKLMNTIRTLS